MSNTILQFGCGYQSATLLGLVEPYHKSYCDSWQLTYRAVYGNGSCKKNIQYKKVFEVSKALNELKDNETLIYLDLDALIVDFFHDVVKALPDGFDIGLVPFKHGYCTGAMWIRSNPKTREFFDLIVSAYSPYNIFFEDKAVINNELSHSDLIIKDLDTRYNESKPADEIVIKSFHGVPEVMAMPYIKAILK